MGRLCRRCVALILLLLLATCRIAVKAEADTMALRRQLLLSYSSGESVEAMEGCLRELEAADPAQGRLWRQLMGHWDAICSGGYDRHRALHDGLAQDDALCIVVFGFGLNADGSMKPELVSRLQTALDAARQYPNAYVAVTGGATSNVACITEADVMAIWLMNNGVSDSRIIIERKALSTMANARNTYRIVSQQYPQVEQLAVVSSDYHVTSAAVMLQAVADYEAGVRGGRALTVAAGISCATDHSSGSSLYSQAQAIAQITGTSLTAETAQKQTEPAEPELWTEDAWYEAGEAYPEENEPQDWQG